MFQTGLLTLSIALGAPAATAALDAATPAAFLHEDKSPEGTIKSVDISKNEFVLSHGVGGEKKDITVKVTSATRYTLDGKDSTMSEALKVGNMAKVTHTDGTASLVAARSKKPSN